MKNKSVHFLHLRLYVLLLFVWAVAVTAAAQDERGSAGGWQQVWHELIDTQEQDDDANTLTEAFELLEQLAGQPLDINRATREELEQLPFLSSQQVMDLQEYLDRYGPMRSLGELRMIRSLDYQQLQLLPYFVYVDARKEEPRKIFPPIDTVLHRARHELTGSLRVPLYTRKGDRNGYLGYGYRHQLRYEMRYGERMRLGLTGTQDAGEPFLANRNRWGYDNYSYYLQLKGIGRVENIVVGKYKINTGKGLLLGNSYLPGKLAVLQNLGRTPTTLRPHASGSEADYLQGVATSIQLSHAWNLTTYASYRPLDATLAADGTATTIITSGYHRTVQEMEKKHNTHATDIGLRTGVRTGSLRAGITIAYTHLDRRLQPNLSAIHRRYHATGHDFSGFSADYAYTPGRLSISGETAIDGHGHLATSNTASLQASSNLSLLVAQRFYSYRYQAFHAHALSEGGHVQNESALMIGTTWRPLRHWQLQAYADYAYFPWARYQASRSSSATDLLVVSSYRLHPNWTLQARYRHHRQERDNAASSLSTDESQGDSPLVTQVNHRCRLSMTFAPQHSTYSLTTRGDFSHTNRPTADRGWMISETATWKTTPLLYFTIGAAWFNTDSYMSRLYLFEHQLPHQYASTSYDGQGMRCSLLGCATIGSWQGHLRVGYTHYFDRSAIGTGLQQIDHSSMTDVEVQLRYRM